MHIFIEIGRIAFDFTVICTLLLHFYFIALAIAGIPIPKQLALFLDSDSIHQMALKLGNGEFDVFLFLSNFLSIALNMATYMVAGIVHLLVGIAMLTGNPIIIAEAIFFASFFQLCAWLYIYYTYGKYIAKFFGAILNRILP